MSEPPSGRVVVVTGTDTEVGKTVVTAALASAYVGRGLSVTVVKPAQTGVRADEPGDLAEVRRLAGAVDVVEPVRLPDPLAPELAARMAGVELPTLAEQVEVIASAAAGHDVVLVEGAGGVTVRLGDGWTLLDLASEVGSRVGSRVGSDRAVQVVVVARPGLGTLNHSVLTVDAVRARGLPVAGLILGSWPADPGLVERLNADQLPALTGVPLLGAVPLGAPRWAPSAFRAAAPGWFDQLP